MSRNLKILITVLFNIFYIILIFDSLRAGLYIPNALYILCSIVRDGILFFLLVIVIMCKKTIIIYKHILFLILLMLPIPIFLMAANGFHYFDKTIAGVYQQSRSILFFFILINLSDFYLLKEKKLVKYFILGIILLFFTVLIIYLKFPHLIIKKYHSIRIGVGNQSIQASLYVFALILCIHYQPFKKHVNIFLCLLLTAAIILSVTATAMAIAIFVVIISLFEKEKRKIIIPAIFFMFIISGIIIYKYWDILEKVFNFIFLRIEEIIDILFKYLTFSVEKTQSRSFSIREGQIDRFFYNLQPIHTIFGSGKIAFQHEEIMMENAYISIIHDYGFFGFFIMLMALLPAMIYSIFHFFKYKESSKLMVISFICMYSMTLATISLITLSILSSLLIYFIFFKNGNRIWKK